MLLPWPPGSCIVNVTDLRGIEQSVEVTAETVFEAAARALSALRRDAWIDGIGPATRLEIQVPQPAITHTVTVQQLEGWRTGPRSILTSESGKIS
jgi:hypothetical protein